MNSLGIAGRIANMFIKSKLTPLLVIASLLLGVFAVVVIPREEDPQILVPMLDVFVSFPGASAREVEDRVTRPMERFLWEIKGVEYLYSIIRPGMNLTIVRFYVGESMEDSIVNLYNKLMSNYDKIPPGVSQPLVKPKSIDDVPVLTLTLWSASDRHTGYDLRRIATELCWELKKDRDIADTTVIGGQKRRLLVSLDPVMLNSYHLTPTQIMGTLQKANFALPSGSFPSRNREFMVETGGFVKDAQEVGNVLVHAAGGKPVYLKDVAHITDGPAEPANYVMMGLGPAAQDTRTGSYEAVTIAIAKKKGANATHLAARSLHKVDELKGIIIPSEVEITTTRNYGATAKEKSNELLEHMLIAALSVTLLIALALGWRESLVVGVAVPVTLALTIFVSYMYGYTLNRVTLFALIFSIGILVDDAIVVVENIHRHFKLSTVDLQTAVAAVDEVGNPTILATFTVIAALLPMAFVRGLMGPYMRPIPVGASAAMLLSLLIAFIISPWLSYIVLKGVRRKATREVQAESKIFGAFNRIYEKNLRGLLTSGKKRFVALLFVVLLLGGSLCLIPTKLVTLKMLPFDNKSELQVVIDMPEGTALEGTAAVARELGEHLKTVPEVANYQLYVGTASPFNFNGLVRHYYLRQGSNEADIQVNFVSKSERQAQSHDIAKRLRPELQEIGDKYQTRVKVVEIPPGPPVLSTLVAEIYGPDQQGQIAIAKQIKAIFGQSPGVVDVDWYVEDDQRKIVLAVDKEKAALNGISTEAVAQEVRSVLQGANAGLVHLDREKEPVELLLRMPLQERSDLISLQQTGIAAPSGNFVALAELVKKQETIADKTIYHNNLRNVTYVVGDVAGTEESPVYAILKMRDVIKSLRIEPGYELQQYYAEQPPLETRYSLKWDGEWQITYEVFRDLGIAFAAVIILIYVMVVGWFRSFIVPLVIIAPIPLSLIGILPAHAMMHAFFTATSMIGFIAGAGIVVRNSIILVDFIELKLAEGLPLQEAIVHAGIIRFRPMLLTALAVVVGSSVILFDPIFQGMAISLMAGEVAATLLSRTMVPVLYYIYKTRELKGQARS